MFYHNKHFRASFVENNSDRNKKNSNMHGHAPFHKTLRLPNCCLMRFLLGYRLISDYTPRWVGEIELLLST